MKRAALYVRVSTDRQTVENQIARLTEIAIGRGWQIVQTFSDAGISGATRVLASAVLTFLSLAERSAMDCITLKLM
jgi:DNA invertase Pin-like site-specific DNA recombinase